jgi:3',5'-cyclic AMP phosphodiesterase CpdA
VINGDLTEGRPQDYQLLRSIYLRNAFVPLYPTMGNHDYYYQWFNKEWDDKRAQETFRNAFQLERVYYDRFENGVHLIFLAPEEYMKNREAMGEGAWLSDEQIKWFEKTLLSSKAPTFVFLHQHLDDTVFKEDLRPGVAQSKQLKKIARKHPQVIWFSGHSHINAESPTELVKKDGVLYVGTSTVYKPIDVSDKPLPGYEPRANLFLKDAPEKSQSRFVDVYKDRIVIRTRNHHLGAWAPGEHVEKIVTPFHHG